MAMQNSIILKVYKNVKNGTWILLSKYFSSNNTLVSYDWIQFYS